MTCSHLCRCLCLHARARIFLPNYYHFHHFPRKQLVSNTLEVVDMVVEVVDIHHFHHFFTLFCSKIAQKQILCPYSFPTFQRPVERRSTGRGTKFRAAPGNCRAAGHRIACGKKWFKIQFKIKQIYVKSALKAVQKQPKTSVFWSIISKYLLKVVDIYHFHHHIHHHLKDSFSSR